MNAKKVWVWIKGILQRMESCRSELKFHINVLCTKTKTRKEHFAPTRVGLSAKYTHTHTHTESYIHTLSQTHMHTNISHERAHKHIHTHTDTRAHTHTHTHTLSHRHMHTHISYTSARIRNNMESSCSRFPKKQINSLVSWRLSRSIFTHFNRRCIVLSVCSENGAYPENVLIFRIVWLK